MHDALRLLFGDHVQAHQVGGARGLARAGNDSQDIAWLQQSAAHEILLGHGHHLFGGARLAATHGMHSPVKIHAMYHGLGVREGVDGDFRAVFRNHAGGVAGLGEDGDRAHRQIFGGVRDGFANGFGDGESVMLAAAAELHEVRHVAFGFDHDARHDRHRLARILAAGGFGREHDGIGAVENGVGHVAGFGARGARILDHRLEHLRGGDDRLAPSGGAADHMLLDDGNFFGRHFDAEIAAGDHDSVSDFEDFFQMIDGLRLFELGDDWDIAAVRGDDALYLGDVGGGAHEGKRNRVDAMVEAELKIFAVFFRERGNG